MHTLGTKSGAKPAISTQQMVNEFYLETLSLESTNKMECQQPPLLNITWNVKNRGIYFQRKLKFAQNVRV